MATRRGRLTSSPPQFGHTQSIDSPQATQKVHSKLQMSASPASVMAAEHFSHTTRISNICSSFLRPHLVNKALVLVEEPAFAQHSENVVHVFGRPSPNPQADDDVKVGGRSTRNDIISFEPQGKYNTVNKIDRGTFNTSSYSFDLTTKQYVLRKQFNLSENKNKFQLGSNGVINTNDFLSTFENSRCYVEYRPVDFSVELEGTQTDFLPDAAAEMNSYLGLFGQQQVGILMYGDSNFTSGQTITIQVYKPTDEGKGPTTDNTHSGTYLLSRVKHSIVFGSQNTYELHMTGIKGAMGDTLKGLQQNG